MNKTSVLRGVVVLLATAALANAQIDSGGLGTAVTGPAAGLWALARIILACAGAIFTIALIYHAVMGALVDRDHFAKIANCVLFGALAFGAYGLVVVVQNATIKTF